ncbi:hypothetical protein ACRALDRAFT_1066307, partial [Sodiomyces alcalophilus JCM 7366]|uniref:uncharacterized protein n=1 Tax=Sodiomyces alcalophilus JCM 7366 TaxID=591952 RepID=UPI0039B5CBE1
NSMGLLVTSENSHPKSQASPSPPRSTTATALSNSRSDMDALDDSGADLDKVNSDSEALGCVERDLAVRFDAEVEGIGQNSLQDLVDDGPGTRNVDILGLLRRGMGGAGGAPN